jgi:hypothetical protein
MLKMETTEATKLKSINYIGSSMNPTLKPGDRLQITPYDGKEIRRGDVIVFSPPGESSKIIHRVASVDSKGIKTKGDNNNGVDEWNLGPDNIIGRVISAQRGDRRRLVFGGSLGQLLSVAINAIDKMDSGVSNLLSPAYQRLASSDIFKKWLPDRMKTRVISFDRAAGKELQLLMGKRVIGRLLPGKTGWHIRRPFRLFVDEETLPENKAEVSGGE